MRPSNLVDHPERMHVVNEVHARPPEVLARGSRMRRVAALFPSLPNAVGFAFDEFASWCRGSKVSPPEAGSRQHSFVVDDIRVTWELHTEFATLTWVVPIEDGESWPPNIGLDALASGKVVAATNVDILPGSELTDEVLATFQSISLCASWVSGGAIATDFVGGADSFTRYVVIEGTLAPLRLGVLVRQVLEIETYRSLALLGLPLARSVTPELGVLETELSDAVQRMGSEERHHARDTVGKLHELSVRAGQLGETTSYRFAASAAYGRILRDRLAALEERSLPLASSLTSYLENRIGPALSTCLAVEKRQSAMAEKLQRATELLNARIALSLQTQNQSVLESIADTAKSQFQLQRAVEGLSTIAISYYLLGILGYVLEGFEGIAHLSKAMLNAAAAPVVIGLVWASLRVLQRKHGSRRNVQGDAHNS